MVDYQMPDESLMSRAVDLHSLVSYQDSAIVSRTLIDKKAGTLTLFAFARGQGLSEHTAPFDAFVYVLEGEAEIVIEGKANAVRSGEMIIMPANKPHQLKAIKPFKMMLVMIRALEELP